MLPGKHVLAPVCLLAAAMLAQSTGVFRGTVVDATGAPIGNAIIAVSNPAVNLQRSVTSGPDGAFSLDLPPGNYGVKVECAGFRIATFAIELKAGQTLARQVRLEIGQVGEAVRVETSGKPGRNRRRLPSAVRGAEEYAPITEEGFQQVRQRPLSTFSADVDTASYSNVRRFLRDGQLPPPDAVRVEELINYFSYSYPEPESGRPIAAAVEMAECPWNSHNVLARIGVRARSIPVDKLPPANLVFLIDVSGSMASENKLPLLQKAFTLLTGQLRARDRVAIVTYAGAAGLKLPSTPGSDNAAILAAIESLRAGGSTAGAAGIQLAYQIARANFIEGGNNRVILATDGDFNVGVSSDAELVRLIESERRHGVFLSVFGFGYGNLKDSKMEKLADHGNGNYAYIDNLMEARKVMVSGYAGTLYTVAKDVKLQVEFNPARVRSWRLIGYENRRLADRDFKDDRKDAGDMGSSHTVTALYEIVPVGAPDPSVDPLRYQRPAEAPAPKAGLDGEALFVKIRYKEPSGRKSREISFPAPFAKSAASAASEDFRFAAAVAEFGMVLRRSDDRGKASYDTAIRAAAASLGEDPAGYRAEMLSLMKQARDLDAVLSRR